MKKTFAMVKPCAFSRGAAPAMLDDIRQAGFSVVRSAETTLTSEQAEWLYREHSQRDHFRDLVDFTISGPVLLLELESESEETPAAFRSLMGPTDIAKAGADTLRGKYAEDFRRNSIHGSDGPESAAQELEYFGSTLGE